MELFINGEKIDITLESEKTVGDVLSSLEKEFAANNATTVNIVINDTVVKPEDMDSVFAMSLEGINNIKLSVVSENEIQASFIDLASKFSDAADKLEQVPVELQSGKDSEVGVIIRNVADEIDRFCHIVNLSNLFPEKYGKMTIDGMSVKDFFADFSPILADFENALKDKDTVTTGDLAEYEISPRMRAIASTCTATGDIK
ncbi:MAG: hypothetical protein K6F69_01905 [Treponema sp.]|nr:hypothetical protein [Treponema sp.]